jgi:hypothetical protein
MDTDVTIDGLTRIPVQRTALVQAAIKSVAYYAVIGDISECRHKHVTVAEAQRCAERREREGQGEQRITRIRQSAWR